LSQPERYAEIGKLLVEHGNRRKDFSILVQKLKDISQTLVQQNAAIASLNIDNYGASLDGLKVALSRHGAEYVSGLVRLINDYDAMRKYLQHDLETLKEYGVK